ncbi:Serine/Threonine-Protein Phosphatase 2A Catalytic Subunit Alpha Isoform [Manis pentadactyla]|nr:Serine/Threonine-Protein Phosphatase 2A Catalytic Subunit Alpha Isoform [Manis pentadactyla]
MDPYIPDKETKAQQRDLDILSGDPYNTKATFSHFMDKENRSGWNVSKSGVGRGHSGR